MELREIPLIEVLATLGFENWRTRKNGEHYGKCPVHNPKQNSTSFSFDATGRFHCFSCGVKGRGAIDLVKVIKRFNFREAVTFLGQQKPPTNPTSEPAPTTPQPTENAPYKASYEKYYVSSDWLKKRGLSEDTLKHYGVGEYNNPARKSLYSGHILFPIRRFKDGAIVGYLSRNPAPTEGQPKYLFPKGVQKALEVFGAWHLKENGLQRIAYLVESPLCVLKFHQLGFPAVSCYGWSVSPVQTTILQQLAKGWIFLPDADKRQEAIRQVLPVLGQVSWVKAPEFPAEDPENLSLQQVQSLTQ